MNQLDILLNQFLKCFVALINCCSYWSLLWCLNLMTACLILDVSWGSWSFANVSLQLLDHVFSNLTLSWHEGQSILFEQFVGELLVHIVQSSEVSIVVLGSQVRLVSLNESRDHLF